MRVQRVRSIRTVDEDAGGSSRPRICKRRVALCKVNEATRKLSHEYESGTSSAAEPSSSPIYILKRCAATFSAWLDGYDINMFVRRATSTIHCSTIYRAVPDQLHCLGSAERRISLTSFIELWRRVTKLWKLKLKLAWPTRHVLR